MEFPIHQGTISDDTNQLLQIQPPPYPARLNRRSEKPLDMRKPKRVRFSEGEHVLDSQERCKAIESPRSDGPKTSEFAYFRKFKGGDVHDHSRSLHKEKEKLRRSKTSNHITETSCAFGTPIEPSRKDLKTMASGERTSAPDHSNLFLSPRAAEYGELDPKRKTDKREKWSSLIYENVKPVGQSSFSSPSHEGSKKDSGNEYDEKGIFSAKRHRLRKLASQTLFSEAEIHHPKGFDFVTALMSRLFPKDNENKDSSKGDADNSSKSLVPHESNNMDKGLQLSCKRDWDKEIPKIKSGGSKEIILPECDSFVSEYPIPNHDTERQVQYLLDQQHPKSWSPYEYSTKPSSSFIFKGLDEHSTSEGLHRPFLEWNQGWVKDRLDPSIFNINHPLFPTSLNIDQNRFTDNVISAKGPCLLFSNNFPETNSLPHTQDFKPDFDDVKYALAEPGLSASLDIDRRRFTDNVISAKGPSFLFSNHFLELGSLPSSGLDFDDMECALAEPEPSYFNIDQKRFADTVISGKGSSFLFSNHFLELDSSPYAEDYRSGFDDVKCALTEPKCITLGKDDRNSENIHCNQNILWDGDSWKKCLSASDFSAEDYSYSPVFHGWKYPQDDRSLLCSFSRHPGKSIITRGAFSNYNLLTSNNEYSSPGSFLNRPLLLDCASCDSPDRELDFGEEFEYR